MTCDVLSHDFVGRSYDDCKREVDLSIQRLFYWGAYADKYGGTVQVRGHLILILHVVLMLTSLSLPPPSLPPLSPSPLSIGNYIIWMYCTY